MSLWFLKLFSIPNSTQNWRPHMAGPTATYRETRSCSTIRRPLRAVLDFGLYGRNRVAVADSEAALYGASKSKVDARLTGMAPIFTAPLAAAQVRARAAAEGIDVLVVSSADPIWSDVHGWVWSAPVLFASPHVPELIATRDLGPER